MKRVSTLIRLSVSLACLTTSILLAAQAVGLIPDPLRAALKGRQELCETLAIYCSAAAQQGDTDVVRSVLSTCKSRNAGIRSMALRREGGTLVATAGDHDGNWIDLPPEKSTADHVQVPVFDHEQRWGTVEVAFEPLSRAGFLGVINHPLARLAAFFASLGFLVYYFYLRRTLQYLDPSSVIPERVKVMLDIHAEGVLVLDKDERIVFANEAFSRMYGATAAQLQGRKVTQLCWASADPEARWPWNQVARDRTPLKGFALSLRTEANGTRTLSANAAPMMGPGDELKGTLVTLDDVTSVELKNQQLQQTLEELEQSRDEVDRKNRELHALATTDPLTGCLNRRSFFEQFAAQWSSARRYHHPLSCVMLDVDDFKRINDRYGHSIGDQVLQQIAAVLKSAARASDVISRYGGEEFCILLPQTNAADAMAAAEKFREAIAARPLSGVSVTVSLGVSGMELGAADQQRLVIQADQALYAAKRGGRNRSILFTGAMNPGCTSGASATSDSPRQSNTEDERSIPFHVVNALVLALEHRDRATAAHSRRVADLAIVTAAGLLPPRDIFLLEVAALLHDIGKMGVPDAILLKPGPLTDEEWAKMRVHDRIGVEIVAAAFDEPLLSQTVAMHHYRFAGDESRGAGGIAGDAIPVTARILSVADAYDAMTSDRPYRKAMSREQACAELRRCAGGQFDPEVVERFIATAVEARCDDGPRAIDHTSKFVRVIDQIAELDPQEYSANVIPLARQLAQAANETGLPRVAQLAAELADTLGREQALSTAASAIDQLLQLARSACQGAGGSANKRSKSMTE